MVLTFCTLNCVQAPGDFWLVCYYWKS